MVSRCRFVRYFSVRRSILGKGVQGDATQRKQSINFLDFNTHVLSGSDAEELDPSFLRHPVPAGMVCPRTSRILAFVLDVSLCMQTH